MASSSTKFRKTNLPMSNPRTVTCNVINNLDYNLSYAEQAPGGTEKNSRYNGDWHQDPLSSIDNTGESIQVFSIKRQGDTQGSTGYVIYNLATPTGGGSPPQLVLMFSNPSNRKGTGHNENCWFYAIIQGNTNPDPSSPTFETGVPVGQNLQVKATVSGFTIDPIDPDNSTSDDMEVTVTIDYINSY